MPPWSASSSRCRRLPPTFILVFIPALGAFLAPDLLGGAKAFMIGSLIDEQFRGSQGNWPFGAAISVILMTLVLIALFIQARAASRGAS